MFCIKICFFGAGAGRSRAFIGGATAGAGRSRAFIGGATAGAGAYIFYLEPEPEQKKKYLEPEQEPRKNGSDPQHCL